MRRQSARFKSEEPEPSEDFFVTDRASGPTTLKPVLVKQDIGNKRFVHACFMAVCKLMFSMDFHKII